MCMIEQILEQAMWTETGLTKDIEIKFEGKSDLTWWDLTFSLNAKLMSKNPNQRQLQKVWR